MWVLWPVWSLGEMSFPLWTCFLISEREGWTSSVVLNLSELFETLIKRHGLLGKMNTRGLASTGGAPDAREMKPWASRPCPHRPHRPRSQVSSYAGPLHMLPPRMLFTPSLGQLLGQRPSSLTLARPPRLDEVTLLDVLPSPDHRGN